MKKIIKIISMILIAAFIAQDAVWANSEIFENRRALSTLQIPSLFQPIDARMDKQILEATLKSILERDYESLEKGEFRYHLTPTIGKVLLDLEFDKAHKEGDTIIVPCGTFSGRSTRLYEAIISPNKSIKLVSLSAGRREVDYATKRIHKYEGGPPDGEAGKLKRVTDEDGTVWEEYEYNSDGKIARVKLFNPVTGEPIRLEHVRKGDSGDIFDICLGNGVDSDGEIEFLVLKNIQLGNVAEFIHLEIYSDDNKGQGIGETIIRWMAFTAYREKCEFHGTTHSPKVFHIVSGLSNRNDFRVDKWAFKQMISKNNPNDAKLNKLLFEGSYTTSKNRWRVILIIINSETGEMDKSMLPEGYHADIVNGYLKVTDEKGKEVEIWYGDEAGKIAWKCFVDAAKIAVDQKKANEHRKAIDAIAARIKAGEYKAVGEMMTIIANQDGVYSSSEVRRAADIFNKILAGSVIATQIFMAGHDAVDFPFGLRPDTITEGDYLSVRRVYGTTRGVAGMEVQTGVYDIVDSLHASYRTMQAFTKGGLNEALEEGLNVWGEEWVAGLDEIRIGSYVPSDKSEEEDIFSRFFKNEDSMRLDINRRLAECPKSFQRMAMIHDLEHAQFDIWTLGTIPEEISEVTAIYAHIQSALLYEADAGRAEIVSALQGFYKEHPTRANADFVSMHQQIFDAYDRGLFDLNSAGNQKKLLKMVIEYVRKYCGMDTVLLSQDNALLNEAIAQVQTSIFGNAPVFIERGTGIFRQTPIPLTTPSGEPSTQSWRTLILTYPNYAWRIMSQLMCREETEASGYLGNLIGRCLADIEKANSDTPQGVNEIEKTAKFIESIVLPARTGAFLCEASQGTLDKLNRVLHIAPGEEHPVEFT
ncbi:MAG: hypothetical protein Q8O01_01545, partial [Candidatus Omnitrophota bacterium]|nr:hypothetical protein [Candidatus Omnitrophota bacterium]